MINGKLLCESCSDDLVRDQLKKIIFFNIPNMPGKTFYEAIFNEVIFGSFFGIAYFAVDGLLKLADDQIKLNKKIGFTAQRL